MIAYILRLTFLQKRDEEEEVKPDGDGDGRRSFIVSLAVVSDSLASEPKDFAILFQVTIV
jgi:hypothetical protein